MKKNRTCQICGKETLKKAPLCLEHEKLLTCPKCSSEMYYVSPSWLSKGQYNCGACQFSYLTFQLFIHLTDEEAVKRVKEQLEVK